jgi:hypothetical protein
MRRALVRGIPACLAAAALLVLGGCGGNAGDLLAVDRSGDIPGAQLRVVVNDGGTVRCNGGRELRMPEPLLLDAREVERDLEKPAEQGLSLRPGPASVLRYAVQTPTGDIRFADTSRGRPAAFDQLAYLVRRIAQRVCRLPR